jgi:hypothetical protein
MTNDEWDLHRPRFDPAILCAEDIQTALTVLSGGVYDLYDKTRRERAARWLTRPDAAIFNDDKTEVYLYRWHVIPRNDFAGVYMHVQVAHDPDSRGFHDHPYDSQATILAGTYVDETFDPLIMRWGTAIHRTYTKGQVVRRKAETLHRLRLYPGVPYTMTLFCTGPRRREKWGFVGEDMTWTPADANAEIINGIAAGRKAT